MILVRFHYVLYRLLYRPFGIVPNIDPEPFRTYNLGTGTGHTARKVVKSIERASAQKIKVQEADRRPGDVGLCVASVERAAKELGWRTEKSLDDSSVDVWNYSKRDHAPQIHQECPNLSQIHGVFLSLQSRLGL